MFSHFCEPTMSQKRERSINFTQDEVDLLLKLVEGNTHILENKKSDAVTWHQKEECWNIIEASFNAASESTHRTSKNLRLKYEAMKRDTRKKLSLIRAYRSGGGPSAPPVLTASELKVKDMILLSVDDVDSNFDYDYPANTEEIVHSQPSQVEVKKENVEETLICPAKRALLDNQGAADAGEAGSETATKWSQWKPSSLRSRKHPALCKQKLKRPFEKADFKMEITLLQKQILEEEYVNKKLQWAFEEEERQHKREMWELEKRLLVKKLNE